MEASGSFFDPCMSLDWNSDFIPALPFSEFYADHKVQAVYVPDNRGGRLYVALACTQERKFCVCSLGSSPIRWHSDLLDLPRVPLQHGFKIPVHDCTLTVYDSELVVIGGNLRDIGRPINLVWSLSSVQWKELPSMPTPRSSVVAVGYSNHLVAAGGKCGTKECSEVEVFNGKDWAKVKKLPCPLSLNGLTSVLHADKKWYIIETNGNSFRATWSAPIEDVISNSPTCEWKKYSRESCPPPGRLPPVSFDGQLVVVGNNGDYKKAKLYFNSQVTGHWVSFENAPYIGPYCSIVGIASLPHKKALALIYKGSEKFAVKIVTHKADSQVHVLDQCLSLSALIKLEYGHNIRVLSQLAPSKLRQLKQKAVFNLKPLTEEDKQMANDTGPAVNFYIDSWLQDESAGCRPTWRNFLVILKDIGMEEMAKKILSKFHMAITPSSGTVSEEILKLQASLVSLKRTYVSSEVHVEEESQKIILPVIDGSLTKSCSVAWAARYAKQEVMTRNRSLLEENKALFENVSKLRRKVDQEQRRIEQQKALDEELTAEEHLSRLKQALGHISHQSQDCGEEIKIGLNQCIKMCDLARKKFANEIKQLTERIQYLEEQHRSHDSSSDSLDKLTEQHIPFLFQQLRIHASKWKEIGTFLGFRLGELSNIEARPTLVSSAPTSWLSAMLEELIQWAPGDKRGSTGFAKIKDLKDALKNAGLAATAEALELNS